MIAAASTVARDPTHWLRSSWGLYLSRIRRPPHHNSRQRPEQRMLNAPHDLIHQGIRYFRIQLIPRPLNYAAKRLAEGHSAFRELTRSPAKNGREREQDHDSR